MGGGMKELKGKMLRNPMERGPSIIREAKKSDMNSLAQVGSQWNGEWGLPLLTLRRLLSKTK